METTLTSRQLIQVLRLWQDKGVTPDRMTQVLASGFLADLFDKDVVFDPANRDAFRESLDLLPLVMEIAVNYELEIEHLIAAGRYDRFMSRYNLPMTLDDFTIPSDPNDGTRGIVPVKMKVIKPPSWRYEDLPELYRESNLRAATIKELLTFGARHRMAQRKHPIMATGTLVKKPGYDPGFPMLSQEDGERVFDPSGGSIWNADVLHLVVLT